MADQQDKRRHIGDSARVTVNGRERLGVLWWTGEDSVMIREDGRPALMGSAWSDEGNRCGLMERTSP